MRSSPPSNADLLALLRPAVALSAAGEIMAGAFIGGATLTDWRLYLLSASGGLLFAAGTAFQFFFEHAKPVVPGVTREAPRPELPLAWRAGLAALLLGVLLAAPALQFSAAAAVVTALLLVVHAAVTRTVWGAGFATAGAARGMNLILGMTAMTAGLERHWKVALPVMVYAMGWEVLRSARQPGAPSSTALVALLHLVGAVALALFQANTGPFYWQDALPFLLLLIVLAFPRFVRAVMMVGSAPVAEAVQYGLMGLLLLEATLAAGYSGLLHGLLVAALLAPLYYLLRRWPVPLVLTPR
jgi:hypothetical protein